MLYENITIQYIVSTEDLYKIHIYLNQRKLVYSIKIEG